MASNVGFNSSSVPLTSSEVAAAGAASGFITRMIAQPLDVLKIRFQLQVEPTRGTKKGHYYGVLQSLFRIFNEEGVRGLWRGHVSAQFLTVIFNSCQFWSYNTLTWACSQYYSGVPVSSPPGGALPSGHQKGSPLPASVLSVCGSASAVFGTVFSMPFDVARTRLVAQSYNKYSGWPDVWQQMVRQEGALSLWRGVVPTLGTSVPFAAIQFPVYSLCMDLSANLGEEADLLSRSAASGFIAGLAAKVVVYPMDLFKKRSQIKGAEDVRQHFGKVVHYKSCWDILLRVSREEGALGWYKGLSPALIKGGVVSAISFFTFEGCCQVLRGTRREIRED